MMSLAQFRFVGPAGMKWLGAVLWGLLPVIIIVLASTLNGTSAIAACSVTYTFSNGTTADATQVNQNFADLANCAGTSYWQLSAGNLIASSNLYKVGVGASSGSVLPPNFTFSSIGPVFAGAYPGYNTWGVALGGSTQDWGVIGMNISFGDTTTRRYLANNAAGWFEWNEAGGIAYVNAPAGTAGTLVTTKNNRLQITGDGKVGIGTSTPSEKLYVDGNIYATGNITCGGSCPGGSSQWNLTGTNLVPTSTTYKVGVGAATSPSTTLDVGGTLNASGAVTLGSSLNVTGTVTCGSGCAAGPWSVSGSNIIPSSTSYNLGVGTTSPTEKLYVTGNIYATGNISCGGTCGGSSPLSLSGSSIIPASTSYNMGIGTTSPGSTAALDIVSNSNWAGGWNGNLRLMSTNFPTVRLYATGINKTSFIGNNADGGLWFGVNGSNDSYGSYAMVLTSGGYLGISSTSPSYPLHVGGTAYATGAAGALSDVRHKKDITELRDSILPKVMKLRPVSYQWKKPTDDGMRGRQIGFIAQEVENLFPDSILTQKNSEKTKGLKYNELVPILTKALQEQQREIQALRTAKENQSAKFSRLQEKVGELEHTISVQAAGLERLRAEMSVLLRNASLDSSRKVATVAGGIR